MKIDLLKLMQKNLSRISGVKGFFENQKKETKYQKTASSYWKSSRNSYIGSEEIYTKQDSALTRLFIPKISKYDQLLDIGCSDGRFAFLIYRHCKSIDAFDLSPHLIKSAKDHAEKYGVKNINFTVQDLRDLKTEKIYNHVMCMGVFTAIPDERILNEAVLKLPKIVKKNGYFVLKDSLASSDSRVYVNKDYAAKYRNEANFKSMFEKIGFCLEIEEVLHTSYMFDQEISSKFLLYKKVE